MWTVRTLVIRQTSPVRCKPVVFTSTKVPKFGGMTSWVQYLQVFNAIVRSNGWDDATVALQLLSHKEGDALNVAQLVPEEKLEHLRNIMGHRTGWQIIDASSTERPGRKGRTCRSSP